MEAWLTDLRRRSLPARGAWLVTVLVGLLLPVAPVAWAWRGGWGVAAAAAAAGVCLVGALLALAAGEPWRRRRQILPAMLLGMVFRMGIPLGFGVAMHLRGGPLADAGFLYYLVLFFEVALITEVTLSLPPALGPRGPEEAVDERV